MQYNISPQTIFIDQRNLDIFPPAFFIHHNYCPEQSSNARQYPIRFGIIAWVFFIKTGPIIESC